MTQPETTPIETTQTETTASYPRTAHTTPTRHSDRMFYDRETIHAILDEAKVCHVAYVHRGRPALIPTIHVRVGERLYLHGSTGSRIALQPGGLPVCVSATLVDGLVLARSAFNHSMNYRCAIVHGQAVAVRDAQERDEVFDALVDHVWAGRSAHCRKPSAKELAATALLRVELTEASAKCRAGDPGDEDFDLDGPWWAGVIPVSTVYGEPVPAADLKPDGVPTGPTQ